MTQESKPGRKRLRDTAAFPVLYMFAAMFIASGILVGVSRLTAGRVDANRQILFEKAVLAALDIMPGPSPRPAEIHRVFTERVSPPAEATAGAYRLMDGDQVVAYALPLEGQGFWDTIQGVVGVKADGMTLTGIAFHRQNETPGLGAEIVKPGFRDQFRGLTVAGTGEPVRFRRPAAELEPGEIHAITGATQTCTRLEKFLNEQISAWRSAMGFTVLAGQRPAGGAP